MVVLESPAKLNIFLEVVNKRNDGYHNIDSVFVSIDLCDTIELFLRDDDRIIVETDSEYVPDGKDNLVYKAVKEIKTLAGIQQGIQVYIRKKIPAGGGLGGGSSNAASVIKELCSIFNIDVASEKIKKTAASLGADIPFFLFGGQIARCRGIGDVVEPLKVLFNQCFVVVNPGISINTGKVYGKIKVPQLPKNPDDLINACINADSKAIGKYLFNRLEEAVVDEYKDIRYIKDELLLLGAQGVLMSGSGSSVFALVDNNEKADIIVHHIRDKHPQWFCSLTKTMPRSDELKSSV
ncbi:MAG: 4-(cytidine 5'-diphospho)-2-C-methyl-D-erythritol kinase [Candidatus Auribacterota bacterium]|jgi:4-diphosphocytidyl-2-C-methyl-D-erythritol kinase|nr:4-(cytidine 5'-diphospho)-2-C-methyl-D-erythritol kinase [Candidatus Auribacterota bacterium]